MIEHRNIGHKEKSRMSRRFLCLMFILSVFMFFTPSNNLFSQTVSQPKLPKPNLHLPTDFSQFLRSLFFTAPSQTGTLIAQKGSSDKPDTTQRINNDTTGQNNSIEIREVIGGYKIILEIEDKKSTIQIDLYNMLGKQVKHIYTGLPRSDKDEHIIDTTDLPKGVYLCVVDGKNFRLLEKFIVTR